MFNDLILSIFYHAKNSSVTNLKTTSVDVTLIIMLLVFLLKCIKNSTTFWKRVSTLSVILKYQLY